MAPHYKKHPLGFVHAQGWSHICLEIVFFFLICKYLTFLFCTNKHFIYLHFSCLRLKTWSVFGLVLNMTVYENHGSGEVSVSHSVIACLNILHLLYYRIFVGEKWQLSNYETNCFSLGPIRKPLNECKSCYLSLLFTITTVNGEARKKQLKITYISQKAGILQVAKLKLPSWLLLLKKRMNLKMVILKQ